MSRRPASVTQADIARAIRAAKQAGEQVAGVKIDRDGQVVVIFGKPAESERLRRNEWDDVYEPTPP